MKRQITILILALTFLNTFVASTIAQSHNLWRGSEISESWDNSFKWQQNHIPTLKEAVHFRQDNSVISINSTVELGNGMQLYGKELLLEGNGNLNMRSNIPHRRSISIPASNKGYANLTIADTLSINAQISLAAKSFGTSASKGSITLKDRSTVTGDILIGNNGFGSGKITVKDNASYKATNLELNTKTSEGGSAEFYILGGSMNISMQGDPIRLFLEDSSRKIILGDNASLSMNYDVPSTQKKRDLEELLKNKQLIPVNGCQFSELLIHKGLLLIKAERTSRPSTINSLLTVAIREPKILPKETTTLSEEEKNSAKKSPIQGYIVFIGAIALILFKPAKEEK